MIVKAQSHPALSHFVTKAMRFYIDCDDLNVGDVLKFSLHCYASQNNKQYFLDNDDNEGLCYQVNCTPKLNPWAAKAAQELKNYAPIVKYNCLHKDAEPVSKISSDNAAKSFSEDSLKSWNTFYTYLSHFGIFTTTFSHCSKSSFFVQKFNIDFTKKIVYFYWLKNSWKYCGFGHFSCWQLWFHEKNCQKNLGWKTRENVGVMSKLNFWTKIWLFE